MRNSLVLRLTLLVTLIICISTAGLAYIMHQATSQNYVRDLQEELAGSLDTSRHKKLTGDLEAAFASGGYPAVHSLTRNIQERNLYDDAAIVLLDPSLKVLATTEEPFRYASISREGQDEAIVLSVNESIDGVDFNIEIRTSDSKALLTPEGEPFARLVVLPEPIRPEAGQRFALSVWIDALPWLLTVIAIALLLTAWVIRRSLHPIDMLTRAAGGIADGKPPHPVSVRHGGAEFSNLLETFNAASRAIADTNRLRKQFISDVAHELRTPVTNIKGQLEAVEAGLIRPDPAFIEIVQSETRLLERLVKDFQQLALSDSGRLHLSLQAVPLAEAVENVLAPQSASINAEFRNTIPSDLQVIADEDRLRQVLLNLLDNARRAKPHGLVVSTRAEDNGDSHILLFEDNGPGVRPTDQPFIFDRFFRAEKSRNRETGGAGLGLAIVKSLVESMGGSVEYFDSDLGGAGFRIVLPSVTNRDA